MLNQPYKIQDAISNALQLRPRRLPLRATFDGTAPEAYADNKQLDRVHSDDWQILFGRRGAGKTTILANYAHYVTYLAQSTNEASIELVASDFISALKAGPNGLTDEIKAQVYFADFMTRIADHFWRVWDDADQRSKFYRRFLTADARRRRQIEDLIIRLKESTMEPTPVRIDEEREQSVELDVGRTRDHSENADVGATVDLSPKAIEAGAKFKLGVVHGNTAHEATAEKRTRHSRTFKFDYFRSRQILCELLEKLKISKVYIFIDEWSELDRSASTDIQPHFAGLLKAIFGNSPLFVVKIGAVRKQTRLSRTSVKDGIVGLEIGADIFVIDLDQLYSANEIHRRQFFEDLVFQHLAYCDARLRDFARSSDSSELLGRRYLRPVETFINYIFRSKDEFGVLIEGAGGLPRDFIEMLDSLAHHKEFSVEKPWTRADVRHAIRAHFTSRKLPNMEGNRLGQLLYEKLVEIVARTRSRTVLVPKDANADLRFAVGDFYHKRMLHDVRSDLIPAGARARFDIYNVDLGLVYDIFARDHQGAVRDDEGWHLPSDLDASVFAAYTVSVAEEEQSKSAV